MMTKTLKERNNERERNCEELDRGASKHWQKKKRRVRSGR